jgi:hypothetical protein
MNRFLFAYFGPATMLLFTSIVAAILGVFMMFGRILWRVFRRSLPGRSAKPRGVMPHHRPHLAVDRRMTARPQGKRS